MPADASTSSSDRSRSSSIEIIEPVPLKPIRGLPQPLGAKLDKVDKGKSKMTDNEPTGTFCSPGLGPPALYIVGQDPDLSGKIMVCTKSPLNHAGSN